MMASVLRSVGQAGMSPPIEVRKSVSSTNQSKPLLEFEAPHRPVTVPNQVPQRVVVQPRSRSHQLSTPR